MNFEFNIFLYDHIIEIKMNKSVKRRADACVEEGLRMNLQSQSQILSYHDESEEEESEQESGSEEEILENEDEREEGLEEEGEDGEVEQGVEQEEGEDEEGIYMGQNKMADYTVDEFFRMGKKNDFPRKKVIFNIKRIFYRAFLHFFNHKRVLKFILIVSRTYNGNRIKKFYLNDLLNIIYI